MANINEKLVVKIANSYLRKKNSSFAELAIQYGVSASTIGRYLNVELKNISSELYEKVIAKKEANRARVKFQPKKKKAEKKPLKKVVEKVAPKKETSKKTTKKASKK